MKNSVIVLVTNFCRRWYTNSPPTVIVLMSYITFDLALFVLKAFWSFPKCLTCLWVNWSLGFSFLSPEKIFFTNRCMYFKSLVYFFELEIFLNECLLYLHTTWTDIACFPLYQEPSITVKSITIFLFVMEREVYDFCFWKHFDFRGVNSKYCDDGFI